MLMYPQSYMLRHKRAWHMTPTSRMAKEHVCDGRPRMEEKRVRNSLVKAELGVKLAYPTYREGLAAIHAGDRRPFC